MVNIFPQFWKSSGSRFSGKHEVGPYGTICTIQVSPYKTEFAFQEEPYGTVHAFQEGLYQIHVLQNARHESPLICQTIAHTTGAATNTQEDVKMRKMTLYFCIRNVNLLLMTSLGLMTISVCHLIGVSWGYWGGSWIFQEKQKETTCFPYVNFS